MTLNRGLPGWAREPLVHFLIAGAAVFALFAWTGGNSVDPSSRVISVDREVQAQLALQFERTMGRSPTDAELDAQIENFVREEVLYREALRLGLDQDDAIVRRRLANKMDMAASARAEAAQPNEETLQAWFEDNRGQYNSASLSNFEQLYFDNRSNAEAALPALQNGGDAISLGEAISLPRSLESASAKEVTDFFGADFAASLSTLEPDEDWQGPIRSGFGWHVVKLRERSGDQQSAFEDVREQVENDWRSATIAARKDKAYQILRDAYRIEIDR